MNKIHWKEWKPELSSDKTLKEVLDAAPRVAPDKIPWQVRLLENPESKIAFPGAVNLLRHDCAHALLCASFHPLDEAFVIGFTMGSVKRTNFLHYHLFKWLTTWFYPKKYRFSEDDLVEFSNGFKLARNKKVCNFAIFPWEEYLDVPIKILRESSGIDWLKTQEDYERWAKRWDMYQFCINDESRLTTWLRIKSEEKKHNFSKMG